jgi:serine phosphatase RsbU (regulator of sigma subunit)
MHIRYGNQIIPALMVLLAVALLLSCAPGTDERYIIPLDGPWKIMRGDNPDWASPRFDDGKWPAVNLPSRSLLPSDTAHLAASFPAGERDGNKGFAWYRKSITLVSVPERRLLLQASDIMNADRVFINGSPIGSTGRFPPDFRSGWSCFRSYEIPPGLLVAGDNIIAIRVYFDAEAWILGPLRIIDREHGAGTKLLQDFLQIHSRQMLSFTLIGLAVFFLFIFIRRRKERLYLYFALCCLSLSIAIGLSFIENVYGDLSFHSNLVMKITQAGLLLFPPFLALFYRSYCNMHVGAARISAYLALPVAGSILVILSGERSVIMYWRNIFLLTIPPYMIDIFYLSVLQLVRRNKSGLLMFLGLLPTIVLGALDILAFSFGVVDSGTALFLYGIPILLFIIALHLVNRFVTSLNQMEKLNRALRDSLIESMRLASLEKELDIARQIQVSSLPSGLPDAPFFDIAVKYVPTEKIGGDYYHFHAPGNGRLGVLVSDVSGHGVPAALISSMVKILSDMLAHHFEHPHRLLAEMSRNLTGSIEKHFLTCCCAFIDHSAGVLHFARAGHLPALIIKAGSEEMIELMPRGRAIGWSGVADFELAELPVRPGDRIILYTDGAIEALNKKGEMFGEESFKAIIRGGRGLTARELADRVHHELSKWSGGNLDDDLTLVVVDLI